MKKIVTIGSILIISATIIFFLLKHENKNNEVKSSEVEIFALVDSLPSDSICPIDYDTLFASIDSKILALSELKKETIYPAKTRQAFKKAYEPSFLACLTKDIEVSPRKDLRFFLVTEKGSITDKYGFVRYYLTGDGYRYYYDLNLKVGVYSFQSANNHDTVPFVVDKSGVYKLGFQEDHPNFQIYKDSFF